MKGLEALAGGGTMVTQANVVAITQNVLSQELERYARGKARTAQLFRLNRDMVGRPGRTIEFPKVSTQVTVNWYTEGQTMDTSNLAYDAVTMTVRKLGVGLRFTTESIEQAKRDIIADALEDAGREVAQAWDDQALGALFGTIELGATTVVNEIAGTILCGLYGAVTGTIDNIAQDVDQNTGVATLRIDSTTGGSATFYYTRAMAGTITGSTTQATVTAKMVLQAKNKVVGKYYDPSIIETHDDRLADLLYDDKAKFLEKSAYGSTSGLLNGEIGQLFGMKTIISNRFPKWCVLVADLNHLGYHVLKREISMKRDEITGYRSDCLFFWGWSERTIGIMLSDAYAVAVLGTIDSVAG